MKIAFLSRILYLSGVTTHMRDLAAELIMQGNSVTILTAGKQFQNHKGMDILYDSLLEVGVKIQIMPYPAQTKSKLKYLLSLMYSFGTTFRYLYKEKFDIIHIHTPVLSFIPKVLRLKFVTTVHIAQLKIGLLHCNATEEIAISKETYNDCVRRGVNPQTLSLIYNGVGKRYLISTSKDKVSIIKKEKGIPFNKVVVGFVGTLCPRKGVDILMQACAILCNIEHQQIHVVLLGNYDSEEDKSWFCDIIEKTGMKQCISVFGYDSPLLFYQMFDIFVLPSRLEGFPLVTIEAMLAGCCVVRSDTEGASEQIEDGETGFLFKNGSVEQLAEILRDLINDSVKRKSVSEAGRMFASKEFTSTIMAEKTMNVYKKIINEY